MKPRARKSESSKKAEAELRSDSRCNGCDAVCCRNLAMMVTRPRTRGEIDELSWYLRFKPVSIYIRNHRWYILVEGDCMYLDKNNMCTIYEKRPSRCRRHQPPDCERDGEYYDVIFSTPDELEKYLRKKKTR